jgi:hypothetical protein
VFGDGVVEKGFALDVLRDGDLTPKMLSPSLSGAFWGSTVDDALGCLWLWCLRMLRKALMLPLLRVQVLLRQASMYSLRSSSGKCSGRSPFRWRSSDMKSLQTLHFASDAGGGEEASSQLCPEIS